MAANSGSDSETYHEVPASKYWYLGDAIGAVPKGFFKFWSPFLVITSVATTVIACETDWWQQFFTRIATYLYITNWFIGWPATAIGIIVLYVYSARKNKKPKPK
jgi:hypothetical protein